MGRCIFSCGQTVDTFLHVGDLVGRLPHFPGLCGIVEVFPPIGGVCEGTRLQHCVHCNDQKGRVHDGNFPCSSFRFFLGDLESVYVLEDAIAVDVVLLNFILQSQDVNHVKSTTYGLEVVEELFGGDRFEGSLFILQLQHPYLVNSVEDEGSCFDLCLGKNIVIRDAGPPGYLLFADDGSFFVVRNAWIVDLWPCRDG